MATSESYSIPTCSGNACFVILGGLVKDKPVHMQNLAQEIKMDHCIKCTPLIESTQESTLSKTLEVGSYSLPGSWIVELLAVFQPPQNIKTLIHADLSKPILDT